MDSGRYSRRLRPATSRSRFGTAVSTHKECLPHAASRRVLPPSVARQAVVPTSSIAAFARVLLVLALPAALASAQEPVDASATPGALALDSFLAEVDTFTAEFEQELTSSDGQLLDTAQGTLSLKRPNRFLWRYESPIEQLVVADGAQLWMYDIELAQATVAPLDSDNPSSPAMLLSGEEDVRDGFDVVEDYASDGADWIRLSPKPGGTDFRSVLIGFIDGLPVQLELVDGLDQVTSITFSGIAVNTDLSDSAFEFEPPPGVDVIGGEG